MATEEITHLTLLAQLDEARERDRRLRLSPLTLRLLYGEEAA